MYLDKREFDKKCAEVTQDIERKEVTSTAWAWMGLGAITGFILSCIRFKKPVIEELPAGKYRRVKDGKHGKLGS
jgi:hypothetical protein